MLLHPMRCAISRAKYRAGNLSGEFACDLQTSALGDPQDTGTVSIASVDDDFSAKARGSGRVRGHRRGLAIMESLGQYKAQLAADSMFFFALNPFGD